MGFLKQLFAAGKPNGSCCDVKITEVKDRPAGSGNKEEPASPASAAGGQSCCQK